MELPSPMSETTSAPLRGLVLALRAVGAIAVLSAMAYWAWQATRWEDELILADNFSEAAPIRSFMTRAEGIHVPGEGLAVPGGMIAKREYALTRGENQQLFLEIERARGNRGRFGLWLSSGGDTVPLDPGWMNGRPIDLTELMPAGNARLELWIENTAPAETSPVVLLKKFRIERRGEAPPAHWPTLVFYGAAGTFFWLVVFGFAVPEASRQLLTEQTGDGARGSMMWATLLLGAAVAAAWLLTLPEWGEKKDYDDRAAIGNAAMLLDDGFNQEGVYFRSRVRPGFLGVAQPVLAASPHRLSGYWLNPSDNFRQEWKIYEQSGGSFGLFTYPHLAWMSRGLAVVMILGFYGIFRRLEVAPALAVAATIVATLYYGRSLTIAITQTVSLTINVLAVWHYLAGGEKADGRRRFVTGLMLGFAFLVKETAATTVIALGLFTLVEGARKDVARRVVDSIPMWVGAAVWPVVYFGGIAEGGFRELFTNFDNHLSQEQLNEFEALTWATGFRDMRVVFSGLGLAAVAIGLAAGAATRLQSRADRFMACWAVGCLPVFTLPYIFPRFLKYFVPSFAYWSVRALEKLRQRRGTDEAAGEKA